MRTRGQKPKIAALPLPTSFLFHPSFSCIIWTELKRRPTCAANQLLSRLLRLSLRIYLNNHLPVIQDGADINVSRWSKLDGAVASRSNTAFVTGAAISRSCWEGTQRKVGEGASQKPGGTLEGPQSPPPVGRGDRGRGSPAAALPGSCRALEPKLIILGCLTQRGMSSGDPSKLLPSESTSLSCNAVVQVQNPNYNGISWLQLLLHSDGITFTIPTITCLYTTGSIYST